MNLTQIQNRIKHKDFRLDDFHTLVKYHAENNSFGKMSHYDIENSKAFIWKLAKELEIDTKFVLMTYEAYRKGGKK